MHTCMSPAYSSHESPDHTHSDSNVRTSAAKATSTHTQTGNGGPLQLKLLLCSELGELGERMVIEDLCSPKDHVPHYTQEHECEDLLGKAKATVCPHYTHDSNVGPLQAKALYVPHTLKGQRTHCSPWQTHCEPFPEGLSTILLGMGCFWGAERLFWRLPGVFSTQVGYAGGFTQTLSMKKSAQEERRGKRVCVCEGEMTEREEREERREKRESVCVRGEMGEEKEEREEREWCV
ncbi:hypothetical protein WMY93_016712 [Mugilogobius chulae]|uniref:peptide-methionine (S)-S-oxide reductase n=1 Tax=Mugilogobius chulae TaxID=88201 RepID=A0AAW0NWB3_9GOBI